MIDRTKIQNLYNTISKDLKISKFSFENETDYRCRLIYSAIGKWTLTSFSDRDYEDGVIDQVSKSHVTIKVMSILNSYRKLDPSLNDYFVNDKELINAIENVYLQVGYVNSGNYTFKRQPKKAHLRIADKTLDINDESNASRMRGLGIWRKQEDEDVRFEDYLLINDDALTYAKKLIKQLKYSEFNFALGKVEFYNIEKNKWEFFNEKSISGFSNIVVRIDDGLDYKVLKKYEDGIYAASISPIYTKQADDFYFQHEIWRVILGICALEGKRAKCYMKSDNDSLIIKFAGFAVPVLEESIIRCMCWPRNNCLNRFEYISDISMKKAINEILEKMSIEVIEGV